MGSSERHPTASGAPRQHPSQRPTWHVRRALMPVYVWGARRWGRPAAWGQGARQCQAPVRDAVWGAVLAVYATAPHGGLRAQTRIVCNELGMGGTWAVHVNELVWETQTRWGDVGACVRVRYRDWAGHRTENNVQDGEMGTNAL